MGVEQRHYACSLLAKKIELFDFVTVHAACTLSAVSKDEAVGKALGLALSRWPTSDGWRGHSINVIEIKHD